MNDMEWSGIGDPEGPLVAGSHVTDDATDQVGEARGACDPEEVLAVAEGLFWSYVKDLESHKLALEAREKGVLDPAELKAAMLAAKGIREAVALLMQERNRVDKLRKDIAGGVGGGSLDLDAARDEVGRRLACLRRA
ncbi:permease [Paracoccus spongiarum]|uniref:Permease n=1 Tax=Paracoccus spongiarum TaxID=3064387 RepID=A0ABT9J788_9RHOB|nr:permease [Paracoccus sp. 2205BS29-5]MDP5305662.1 permease [Paracoccus sp. 2205BS29-5]